jgi:hypothetical protein
MDVAEFQRWIGPLAFRFVADNADLIKFLAIAGVLVGGWLVADGHTPRRMFERMTRKGTSDGRGDIPSGGNDDDGNP